MVNKVVATKLTEEEHDKLLDACNEQGCTPSAFIKKTVMNSLNSSDKEENKESPNDKLRKIFGLDKK